MSAHLSIEELAQMGLRHGARPMVSRRASIYGAPRIVLGDDVRIDDFCVLSAGAGGIDIGSHVHVAAFVTLIGRGRITLSNYSGLSARVSVYSSSDDYSGEWMTNPTVPESFTNVQHADVFLGPHVIVGAGSVILPGAVLAEGCAVGALSLVRGSHEEFTVISGVPARRIGQRSRRLLDLAASFEEGSRPAR